MYNQLFYDELIKRYIYLYENKELILSMCIRKINIDEKLKEEIKNYEKYNENLELPSKDLFEAIIVSLENQLGIEKYYLCSDVSNDIVKAYEDFLFTDGSIDETDLYKHVEALKKNSVYMENINDMIDSLNERRSYNHWLRSVPAFTVWKILGYVRRANLDNAIVLEALDRYYNIDRTVMSGVDSECGYELYGDECMDDDKLSKYPNMTFVSGVPGSYILFSYEPNEYEIEDDYIHFRYDDEEYNFSGEAKTLFMEALSKLPNLDYDSKINLYNYLNFENKLIL